MFFKGGNAFLVNGFPPYRDDIQSGGTARMAKSRRMGKTRKGKGRKGSKDGKKTRRVRCWSRRNKEAQRYVVCSGSRGQKSMRYKRKLRSRKQTGGVVTRGQDAQQRADLEEKLRKLEAEFESIKCTEGSVCDDPHDTGYCQWCQDPSYDAEQKKLKDDINEIRTELGLPLI